VSSDPTVEEALEGGVLQHLWNRDLTRPGTRHTCHSHYENLDEDNRVKVRIREAVGEEILQRGVITEPHQDPMTEESLVVMGNYIGQA
jgi:hypothetical protein